MEWTDSTCGPYRHSAFYLLPNNYKLLTFLGRGGFGEVLKCVKEDTRETVAVKIPHHGCSIHEELTLMNFFKWKNLDQCNIVRFIDSFTLRDMRTALAFEMLDMTLKDYIFYQRDFSPLELYHVRSAVQQMATALNALKINEMIHADIKLDNIMLVDRHAQPISVKLIDFGLAFPTCKARQGDRHQTTHYKAPEIILGLPFSEAIDMWSLGVVMGFMLVGDALFPGNTIYDTMRCIVELLGVPPDDLLSAGKYSYKFFVKTSSGRWRLKTPREFWGHLRPAGDCRAYQFCNLDDLETLPLKNLNMVEADERKDCIDLLKAMLRMDANERITPSQVLAHPFITRGTLNQSSDNETLESGTSPTAEPGTSKTAGPATTQTAEKGAIQDEETQQRQTEDCSTCGTFGTPSTEPAGVVLAPPPQTNCSLSLEYGSCSKDSGGFYGSTLTTLPRGVLLVRPAPAEFCLRCDEDSEEQSGACPLDWLEDPSENTQVENPRGVESDPPPVLAEDCSKEQDNTELSATSYANTEPERKKKRNCFKRFFTWTKRIFFSCISSNDEEG